jgi:hypothetical protein
VTGASPALILGGDSDSNLYSEVESYFISTPGLNGRNIGDWLKNLSRHTSHWNIS